MIEGVGVEVMATPWVNHAMAHTGLPFLRRVVVDLSRVPIQVKLVRVEVAVRDSFGELISRPWSATREDPAERWELDDLDIAFDPAAIGAIEEETAAEITVTATVDGIEAATVHTPIRLLAARQWVLDQATPLLCLELLAAFVQPNHPSIAPLVAATAERLATNTGSGSLNLATATPKWIDSVVEAAFQVVHDEGIHYAMPPASWGYGQKVRTPGDVIDDHLGTCLDTTIILAAVLEQIGIPPVIWIGRGHAFLGYWRHLDRGLPDAATRQVAQAANAVDLELMGVVETTMVTKEKRPPRDLFRRAAQEPRDSWFTGLSHELLGVVDIGMARLLRIHPLPARRERADGVIEVIEYAPATQSASHSPQPAAAAPDPAYRSGVEVPARIRGWKNALLDLTLRNRLLNLNQPTSQVPLRIPTGELGTIADHLQSGRTLTVRALDDLAAAVRSQIDHDAHTIRGDVQRDLLTVRSTIFSEHEKGAHKAELDKLRFRAQSGRRETGANPLVLTLGRLDWTLGDRDLSAPLLLLPVEIKGLTLPYRIAHDPSGEVTVNLSLLEKLRLEFGLTVPDLAEPPRTADGLVDVAEILHRFRTALDQAQLAFRVIDEARLVISGFTGYLLWRDLDEHWERFCESPLVRHLVESPTDEYADPGAPDAEPPTLDEVVAVSPIPADGSQAAAIALARAGKSFVLEGPPGTGKSQTITNILADQMVQGRTVLFVAEKGAALNVVRKRLGQIGLLPFTLDLHDHNARPATVKASLKSALAQLPQADADGYRVAGQDVRSSATLLTGYRDRLHTPNPAGLSLWDARAQQLARGDGPTLPVSAAAVAQGFDTPLLRRAVADAVAPLAELGPDAARAWGFAGSGGAPVEQVTALARALDAAVGLGADGLPPVGTVTELAAVGWLLTAPDLGSDLADLGSPRWNEAVAELRSRTETLANRGGGHLSRFTPAVFGVAFDPVRQGLREAQASFFIGRKGRLVRAAADVLNHLRPGAEVKPAELIELVDELAVVAGEQERARQSWAAIPGLAPVAGLDLVDPDSAGEINRLIEIRLEAARRLAALGPTLAREVARRASTGPAGAGAGTAGVGGAGPAGPGAPADAITEIARLWTELAAATSSPESDQRRYAGESGLLAAWAAGRTLREADQRGTLLGRWRRAAGVLDPLLEPAGDARWALLTGDCPAEEAPAAFDRGVAAASHVERWAAGGFEDFHAPSQDRTATRYVSATKALQESLTTVLPAALLDRRPFKPGSIFGRAAALDRELNRSRGGASVRQLIADHGAVIGQITPCVLVSPDSLARFVPPGAMDFDLVVFDEASQIRVPDAIGALGRARACVVAGDSKQLPPTAFAQVAVEEDPNEDDFTVIPDEESLLGEAVQTGLPRHWLSWHYRSTDESLIAFSNDKYYDGRLSSFPAFPASQFDTGISFTRVDGHFRRSVDSGASRAEKGLLRTNPAEASAVVEEVLRRWGRRERSIGVVTFNVQQRNLIQRMLWESGVEGIAESLVLADDGLFVKNLENVQGDERDVIIFSTAFSANQSGTLPLNFGPLNRAGGERRLNVAITRARRRVMVFSSFEPEDIRVEQTNSAGVHHLRAYLEVAKYGTPPEVTPSRGAVDRHRDELAEALRERGLAVGTAVGLSDFRVDLVVTDPARGDSSALAVLLDGPGWAGRATTGDRDGLPEQVLRSIMGWPEVRRVWLPEWLSDPTSVLDDVVEAVAAVAGVRTLGEAEVTTVFTPYEPGGDSPVLDAGEEPTADPLDLFNGADDLDEGPYADPDLGTRPRARLDRLTQPSLFDEGVALVREIVVACGPVSVRRVARLIVNAHGLSRLTETRVAQLRALVPADLRRDPEGFLWPAERDPLRWEGYRSSEDAKERPLEDIALREIANVQCHLARTSVGISIEELHRETLRTFGGNRVTDTLRERLQAALELAIGDERVKVAGDIVVPVG